MRDYYEHTRDIFRVTERITQQFVSGYVTSKTRSLFSFLPLIRADKTPIGTISSCETNICIQRGAMFFAEILRR